MSNALKIEICTFDIKIQGQMTQYIKIGCFDLSYLDNNKVCDY